MSGNVNGMRYHHLKAASSVLFTTLLVLTGVCGCGRHTPTPVPPGPSVKPSTASSDRSKDKSNTDTPENKTDSLIANYLNLGVGNCILLTTPSGKHVMIDAAPAGSEQDLLAHLQQAEIATLDYVIVTCPTGDHIGCLPALLGGMTYGEVLTPGCSSPLMDALEHTVHAGGRKIKTIRAGSVVPLDDNISLEVLAPDKSLSTPTHPTQDWYDNHSLVFRIRYNKAVLLFTGDMGTEERNWLYSEGANLHAAILSGLHHGDRRIADIDFVHTVVPLVAIIMCRQGNKEGYPHRETLDVMNSTMSKLYRTDVQKEIVVHVRPEGQISVTSARPASDHEMSLAGSEVKGELDDYAPVHLDNPTQESDPAGMQDSGALR